MKSASKIMASMYKISILFLLCIYTAESADPTAQFCNDAAKINTTQTSSNIDHLLAKLVPDVATDGFSAASYGDADHRVYALGQCRGDVSRTDCSNCIHDAATGIRKQCPNQADARIWYEYCFLRYNTKNFFGQVDTSVGTFYYNVNNVTDPENFNKELGSLMNSISSQAVKPANKGLGKGKKKLSPFFTQYALVQCMRDLSDLSCAECLATAVGYFPVYCNNKRGCRVLYSSCYVRYELYPFYFPLDKEGKTMDNTMEHYSSIVLRN